MHINHHIKAAYLHVMKTGGTSMYLMLGMTNELLRRNADVEEQWVPVCGMHATYSELHKSNPDIYNQVKDYYKFTFARNPWDHAVSSYFHHTDPRRLNADENPSYDFSTFIKNDYRYQSMWTFNDTLFEGHEFYRFENFETECRRLFSKLGYRDDSFTDGLVHKNKTEINIFNEEKPADYRVMYNQENIDIVANLNKRYINEFNYSF